MHILHNVFRGSNPENCVVCVDDALTKWVTVTPAILAKPPLLESGAVDPTLYSTATGGDHVSLDPRAV